MRTARRELAEQLALHTLRSERALARAQKPTGAQEVRTGILENGSVRCIFLHAPQQTPPPLLRCFSAG